MQKGTTYWRILTMRLVILPTETQPGPTVQSQGALVALGRLLDEMAKRNTAAGAAAA